MACKRSPVQVRLAPVQVFSIKEFFGIVAQLGERCVRNAEAEGSIPFRSTISRSEFFAHSYLI